MNEKKDRKIKFAENFKATNSENAVPIEEIIKKEFKKFVFEAKEKKNTTKKDPHS